MKGFGRKFYSSYCVFHTVVWKLYS